MPGNAPATGRASRHAAYVAAILASMLVAGVAIATPPIPPVQLVFEGREALKLRDGRLELPVSTNAREAARDIGIGEAAPWPVRLAFTLGRAVTRAVDGLVRWVLPQFSISRMLTRVIGYHMLSRFLLDQTRPLGLPEQVLNPMRSAIAGWHHEPRAPGWLNRVEDALTTRGRWEPAGGDNARTPGGVR